MQKAIIRLSSVTYAIRAQKMLEQRGIRATVKKISRSMQVSGCGYGIEVGSNSLEEAKEIVLSAGIRIIGIE